MRWLCWFNVGCQSFYASCPGETLIVGLKSGGMYDLPVLCQKPPACIAILGQRIFAIEIGMTAESILERIKQKPFRPIAIEAVGGTWIEVDREADIFIYDRKKTACVVIFDPEGRKFIFEPEQISAIEAR